jgi:hypothetical protein
MLMRALGHADHPTGRCRFMGKGLDLAQALHKSNGALAIEQLRVGAKYPMVGIRRLLRARAASGHAAAAPPSSVMNSRHLN